MNSGVTFFLATIAIAGFFGLMVFVDKYWRWKPWPWDKPTTETLKGYEHPELVEVIFRKTLAYEPKANWSEMDGVSTVLDFGGGCGLHYKEANSKTVRWAVVETPAMVARAKDLATDRLQFFTDIDGAARWLGPIDVMHSDGALQYADDPASTLKQLCALGAQRMLWKRVALSEGEPKQELQSSRLADNGPGRLRGASTKSVKYIRTAIPISTFLAAHDGYDLIEHHEVYFLFHRRDAANG